jgi:hypothetical protein
MAQPHEPLWSLQTEADYAFETTEYARIIATRCAAEMQLSFNCILFIDFQKLELYCRIGKLVNN